MNRGKLSAEQEEKGGRLYVEQQEKIGEQPAEQQFEQQQVRRGE